MNPENDIAELRAELVRAQEAIEKLQQRIFHLEHWLQEVPQPDGTKERRVFCNSLTVHPPGRLDGMRWELSASDEGTTLVLHSGAGEELLQIADTPDGRGPLLTMYSHDGTQTVQLGAGPSGGGVVRVANEEGTGLVLLTTDGDSGRIGVAHAKTKALAALHTQKGTSGLEVHDAEGRPAGVFQASPHGGALGLIDAQGRPRVTAGMTAEGHAVMKLSSPGSPAGFTLIAGANEVNLSLNAFAADGDSVVLRALEAGVALNFWSGGQPVMHLATCQTERSIYGSNPLDPPISTEKGVAHGSMLRLTGTNSREIELNPLEVGRQFVLLGDEKLPLVTLGADVAGVQFILNDGIGMPKLQLFARDDGGFLFVHDAEHAIAATLPPDIEFDQDGEDEGDDEEEED